PSLHSLAVVARCAREVVMADPREPPQREATPMEPLESGAWRAEPGTGQPDRHAKRPEVLTKHVPRHARLDVDGRIAPSQALRNVMSRLPHVIAKVPEVGRDHDCAIEVTLAH